jgi:hypothetical protein
MLLNRNHPYIGFEFDWIATDKNGDLAIISTAGFGPIPEVSLIWHDLLSEFPERIFKLPVIGSCRIIGEPGYCLDWKNYAERGFYAYDWNDMKECYDLMGLPGMPIRIEDISDKTMADAALAVKLDLLFKESKFIAVDCAVL